METKQQTRNPLKWLSMKLGTKFGIGIITIVPFALTIWILYEIFIRIDDILQPFIKDIWGHNIPGVGFAATLILILLVGLFASNFIGARLIAYFESLIPGMPLFHQLYTGIKQTMESFSASKGANRMEPVIMDFPRKGVKALCFITSEIHDASGKKLIVVFVPNSPNPTSGFLRIVEESEITRTNISIQDALKMTVSAGRVVPQEIADAFIADFKTGAGE